MSFTSQNILFLLVSFLALEGSSHAADVMYVVRENDTLSRIARSFGVSQDELVSRNQLDNPDWLVAGQTLHIPTSEAPPSRYKVQAGDNVSKIAKRYQIPQRELIRLNRLPNPNSLSAGETIRIPAPKSESAPHLELPRSVRDKLNAINVKKRRWKHIVIHHSASRRGNARTMERYHREERFMENGLAYHFVVGNGIDSRDGSIEVGSRWTRQINGGHLASEALNKESIGICLVGNFDKTKPTAKQIESLRALILYLLDRCNLGSSAVRSHQQINTKPTNCPGRHFPLTQLLASLKREERFALKTLPIRR